MTDVRARGQARSRTLALAGLVAILLLGGWFMFVPWRDASWSDSSADALDGQPPALAADATGQEAEPSHLLADAAGDHATLTRNEASADDDGRVRVVAAEVLVLDAQGLPLPGATVEATVEATGGNARDERTTDTAGKAIVRLPEAATLNLHARAAGHLPTGLVEHPFGEAATIAMARAARLLVTVTDASGNKLAGVRVGARGRTRVDAATDAQGAVVLDEIRSGTYDIALTCERELGCVRASMVAGLFLAPGDNVHAFALAKGNSVSGIVRDAGTQAPLVGADVVLRWESRGGGVYGFDHQQTVLTDSDGRFAFQGVAPGQVRVRADTRAHCARTQEQDLVTSDGDVQLEFALLRAAIVRGGVFDASRQPVAGAEVTLGFGQDNGLRFVDSVTTDAEGRFAMTVAPRDGLLLVASTPGRGPGGALLGKVEAGEVRDGVDIEMKRGVAVRGRVRNVAGVALPLVEVSLVPKLGAERFARVAQTDGNGWFRFDEVAAFQYRVEARAPDYATASLDVNVRDDKAETDAGELRLQRAYVLQGVVVARGAQVGHGGVRVMVRDATGKGSSGGAMTDDFGRFQVSDLLEGDYLLDVRGPDVVQQTAQRVRVPRLPAGSLLRVPVDAMVPAGTGIIELRVVDPSTRQPLAGVSFGGIDGRRIAYADGIYSLRGIPAGRVDLRLRARGYQPLTVPAVIVLSGRVRDLRDIALQAAGSLRLRVVDERGRPFRTGQVKLELIDKQTLTDKAALTPTEANAERGTWSWDGLALSRFELRVRGPDTHEASTRAIDAFAPQLTNLRVQLARKPKRAR